MRLSFLAVLLLIAAPAHAGSDDTLTVLAAASLTDAFIEIGDAFEDRYDVRVRFSFAGSSTLAAQLAEGAPADVFASANPVQMDAAIDAGRIGTEPVTFAHNRLIIALPSDNPAEVDSLEDLADDDVALVVAAEGVPVRAYTDAMLDGLAGDLGADTVAAIRANIVSEEVNVRQVVARIALGDGDAGIVYQSDVTPDIADDVITLDIPTTINALTSYPIAITDDSRHPDLAADFIDFVLSDDGQTILAEWGFVRADRVLTINGSVETPLLLDALAFDLLISGDAAGIPLDDLLERTVPDADYDALIDGELLIMDVASMPEIMIQLDDDELTFSLRLDDETSRPVRMITLVAGE
jgi:molybdate transport system substrate-binding protein